MKKVLLNKRSSKGFSILDIIVAVGLITVLITLTAYPLLSSSKSTFIIGKKSQALALANEAVNAVRSIRDSNFSALIPGTYGLAKQDGNWVLVNGSDVTDDLTRQILVENIDSYTRRVTVTVFSSYDSSSIELAREYTDVYRTIETAPTSIGGMLVYADYSTSSDDLLRYKTLDSDMTWSSQQTVADLLPVCYSPCQTRIVRLYSNPNRNEKILVAKFVDSFYVYTSVAVWNGSSWGNVEVFTQITGSETADRRSFDGVFLSNGDFHLIYGNSDGYTAKSVWNGSTWSAEEVIYSSGSPSFIVTKKNPNSDTYMLVVSELSYDKKAFLWSDNSFSEPITITTDYSPPQAENIAFAWSENPPQYGALVYNDNNNSPKIRIWNGSAWSSPPDVNVNTAGYGHSPTVDSIPGEDSFIACMKDNQRDINCYKSSFIPIWLSLTDGYIEDTTDAGYQRSYDLQFENSGEYAVVLYDGFATNTIPKYRTYSKITSSFSSEYSLSGVTANVEYVIAKPSPINDDIMFIFSASDQDVWTIGWDGDNNEFYTSGGLSQTEQALYGSQDIDPWFDFVWDEY